MTDLYAILGVPRGADRAAVRRAYREKASTAHPDRGGTPEAFAAIKTAHDVLTDDILRRRYNETRGIRDLPVDSANAQPAEMPVAGHDFAAIRENLERPVDSRRTQLMEMLIAGHDLAMIKASRQSQLPKFLDMARLTRDALRERRKEWTDQRLEFETTAAQSREILAGFKAIAVNYVMQATIMERIKACETQIESLSGFIKLADEALELLNAVTWDDEPTPAQPWLSLIETIGTRYG